MTKNSKNGHVVEVWIDNKLYDDLKFYNVNIAEVVRPTLQAALTMKKMQIAKKLGSERPC